MNAAARVAVDKPKPAAADELSALLDKAKRVGALHGEIKTFDEAMKQLIAAIDSAK